MKQRTFRFLIADPKEEMGPNIWYRRAHWKSQNFLVMEGNWSRDWRIFSKESEVVGVTKEGRENNFLIIGDSPDFGIFLEREPNNPYDRNAIKVMGSATVNGRTTVLQLGYLSKETAEALKNEGELDARARSVWLRYGDCGYGLRVTVLVRSEAYKKALKGKGSGNPKAELAGGVVFDGEEPPVTASVVFDGDEPPVTASVAFNEDEVRVSTRRRNAVQTSMFRTLVRSTLKSLKAFNKKMNE